jgi:hypothetical protein
MLNPRGSPVVSVIKDSVLMSENHFDEDVAADYDATTAAIFETPVPSSRIAWAGLWLRP